MIFRRHRGLLAGSSLSLSLLLIPDTLDAAQLQPHRAVYDMRLAGVDGGAEITDVSGRMVYELSGSMCNGFTVDIRFVLISIDDEGLETITDLRSSYFEAPDNGKLSFAYKTFVDDFLAEQANGTAVNESSQVEVDLAGSDDKQISFDGSIMFPMQHLHSVIDGATAGQKFMVSKLYDGSATGQTLFETTVVVGRQLADPLSQRRDRMAIPDALARVDAWPVTVAYFNLSDGVKGERSPDYQFRSVLHENGVSRSMHLNYGLFELYGALVELELQPMVIESTCGQTVGLEDKVGVPAEDAVTSDRGR